jgi:hypothetical protein
MPPPILSHGQTVAIANVTAAAANLRTEIHRAVPLAQREGALFALAELEYDALVAIGPPMPRLALAAERHAGE